MVTAYIVVHYSNKKGVTAWKTRNSEYMMR